MDVFDVGQRGRKLVAVAENRARNPVSEFSRSIADGVATYGSGCANDIQRRGRLAWSAQLLIYCSCVLLGCFRSCVDRRVTCELSLDRRGSV